MKTLKHGFTCLLVTVGLGFASIASAALVPKLSGAVVYDSDLNITWLADANLAASNTFGVAGGPIPAGTMDWNTAQSWIAAMDTANYLGYNDWRLPTALDADGSGPSCFGVNCTGSELGHLFYGDIDHGLGGTAGSDITLSHNDNYNLFSNIQPFFYWTGTEFSVGSALAWGFNANGGFQFGGYVKDMAAHGWAVRSGDVAAVPLPAAIGLFGSALTVLVALGSWNKRRG